MNKNYRILKYHWKDDNGDIHMEYRIQYASSWGYWKCVRDDFYLDSCVPRAYKTKKDACAWIERILKEVPENKEVKC